MVFKNRKEKEPKDLLSLLIKVLRSWTQEAQLVFGTVFITNFSSVAQRIGSRAPQRRLVLLLSVQGPGDEEGDTFLAMVFRFSPS